MVRTITRVFGTGLLSLVLFIPGASAGTTNVHASIFRSIDGHGACFTYYDNGVFRSSTTGACADVTDALSLMAPIIYTPEGGNSVTIYGEGNCSTGHITCDLESFDYDGRLLRGNSLDLTGSMDQSASIEVTYWGFSEITCSFPVPSAGENCKLLGIDVVQ